MLKTIKVNIKTSILIFVFTIMFFSCKKHEPIKLYYPTKDFFIRDSLFPYKYLQIENFNTFQELKDEVERTVCQDSTAIVELKVADTIKKIRLINFCFRNYHVDYKQRNVIEIFNDTILKGQVYYPIDSLYKIMDIDFNNNGENRSFSDNPKKLVIHMSYAKSDIEKMKNALNLITTNMDKIGMNDYLHLQISRFEKIEVIESIVPSVINENELIMNE